MCAYYIPRTNLIVDIVPSWYIPNDFQYYHLCLLYMSFSEDDWKTLNSIVETWDWENQGVVPKISVKYGILQFQTYHVGVSENSVPLNPMVLLIIIPIKWLFHWEYTLFSDKPICRRATICICKKGINGRGSVVPFWSLESRGKQRLTRPRHLRTETIS